MVFSDHSAQGSGFAIRLARYPQQMHAAPYAALFLRLVLTGFFIAHLYSKYFTRGGFQTWWHALTQHYPVYVPIYVLTAEFAAALLLPLGMGTRWVSLYAAPAMAGVVLFWLKLSGYWFTIPGAEFPIAWLCMLLLQAMLGDGAYALKISHRRPPGS